MRRFNGLAAALLLAVGLWPNTLYAQQQYDPGGKAKVSTYCKTTTAGDTPCSAAGGGGGSNAAAGPTGSAVPADGSYNALNVGGTLRGQTGVNPSGSNYAAQTDISSVGGTAVSTSVPIGAADGTVINLGQSTDAASCASGTSLLACQRQLHSDITGSIPAGTAVIGFITNDPCGQATKLGAPISLTASGQVITGTSAKKTYICSIDLVSATAQNIALVEGTGSTCATNIFGLAGGTTAATGWNLSANGGLTKGSGVGTVYSPSADTNAAAANVCILLSSTGQTSGQITYVQQ